MPDITPSPVVETLEPAVARRVSPAPRHVAIIMDGNRRWAQARGLPVVLGHERGADAARRTVEAAARAGIQYLTLYAFSTENWRRSAAEVTALMRLLSRSISNESKTLEREGVRLRVVGDRARLPLYLRDAIEGAEARTAAGTTMNLVVALSYGAREELLQAARRIAAEAAAGRLDPELLDEHALSDRLWTAGMPDPDLLIRTSGERRISNFLLWQAAYAELVFQEVLWPDYDASWLEQALAEYAGRERRFGAGPR